MLLMPKQMRLHPQSTVKSKILPIAFVEDIPVKALMPNLVQLYQKSGFFESKILPIVPKVFAGETVFDWIFGVYEDNFHNSGLDYGYPRIA